MEFECGLCGYIEDDEQPPMVCPVCGAPRARFAERYEDEFQTDRRGDNQKDGLDEFEKDLFADYED